jgi:hypothetical protein
VVTDGSHGLVTSDWWVAAIVLARAVRHRTSVVVGFVAITSTTCEATPVAVLWMILQGFIRVGQQRIAPGGEQRGHIY